MPKKLPNNFKNTEPRSGLKVLRLRLSKNAERSPNKAAQVSLKLTPRTQNACNHP
jgi:hypothetical protein